MLLKAQTYDIQAQRPKEQVSGWSVGLAQFFRTQKKTIIWAIILVSAITSAAIFVRYYYQPNQTEIPPELLARLEPFQIKEYAYRQTLTKNPNDLEALIDLGNLYFDNKMYQLAINTYQRALDIDPKNYDVRTDTAIAYFYAGATDTAIEELQKVLEKDPNHAMAYYNMGIVQWHGKNDLDKAIESFNKYLEIQPNGRVADQAKENIKEITALQQDGGNK
jgi:tetratricopeptide (TPR) repeat protein